MDWLFAWDHLIFVVPILVGTFFALGSVLGLHGDTGHDAGHDVHAGHDGGHHDGGHHDGGHHDGGHHYSARSFLSRTSALLGFGKAPMTTLLMVMAFAFGIPGLGTTILFESLPGRGLLGLLAGLTGFLTITPLLTRLMARVMPSTETEVVGLQSLIGEMAYAEFDTPVTETCHATVNTNGTTFQIEVKVASPLKKGDAVLLTDFNSESKQFLGSPAPKAA